MKNLEIKTPSEFYRMRRPEYFSDSNVIYDFVLTREVLAFEIDNISTNQKQDLFEGFCRRIVEKVVTPNLIPQTGPTGGGDGKTDSETYPVSAEISDRWFIPDNGWNKDEKWAFAFSAKKTWKSKAESDIQNILSTEREFTRIYFISNQTISSKQRKDAQDKFKKTFGIDVIIFDGTWLLEEVFKNNLIDIAVDSLNLSSVYKSKKIIQGANDVERVKSLEELEKKIQNPDYYTDYDYQKVEDALETAILARQLERPKDEIEGKFDRAIRFCKKLNFEKHWIRIHYQKAWTYLYYFDDYSSFITEYKNLKKYISLSSSSDEIELYVNLFNSLRGFCASNCKLEDFQINLELEKKEVYSILEKLSKDESRPNTSLKAEIDLTTQLIMDSIEVQDNPDSLFKRLYDSFNKSIGLIDFPFESYHQIFEEIGSIFPNNIEYDKLIDLIASIAEKRTSELSSGRIYLQRGGQKYVSGYYKESIVYFGKAVLKLAKEETEYDLSLALRSLGHAFSNIGLLWASNNCFISANFIAFKPWRQQGKLNKRTFECTKQLAINELLLGRIPLFLTWHELLSLIGSQIDIDESKEELPTFEMLDAFLSVRLANTYENDNNLSKLPDILEQHSLWNSQNTTLLKLGYTDQIIGFYKKLNINSESELINLFEKVANQPFQKQMIYNTDFLSENKIIIKSKILGCTFTYQMENDAELLFAAETFASFFENYLSTSINELFPKVEEIEIQLIKNNNEQLFSFEEYGSGAKFNLEINKFSFSRDLHRKLWEKMVDFSSLIISKHFFSRDTQEFFKTLFEHEEINERLTFVFEHRNFSIGILGENPKINFSKWISNQKSYPVLRKESLKFKLDKHIPKKVDKNFIHSRHDESKVISIINDNLWNQAKWKGFGPFYEPNIGYGIFLAFENGEAGKAIFDDWINRFGKEDTDNTIKITIVKGVNSNHPYWYKIHIAANMDSQELRDNERYMSVLARFHQMTPNNPNNLNMIEQLVKSNIGFLFCPASIANGGKDIEPYFDKAILKNRIDIKSAWELSENDLASVVIVKGDKPIIPSDIKNAPVLEIIKKRKL